MKHFFNIFMLCFVSSFPLYSFLIIGHRGACGYKPENTLLSFQKALDLHVAMIELDVYVCKTGELVVTHDDDVSVTTNGFGKVKEMSFEELRQLKVKHSGQIPTLPEVIDLVHGQIPINIELKGPGTAEPVAKLLQKYLNSSISQQSSSRLPGVAVSEAWVIPGSERGSRSVKYSSSDFVISSFDHLQVQQFKKLLPKIKVGVLFSWRNMPKNIVKISEQCQANFIGVDAKVVTQKLVDDAHQAGFLVYVWTVNDKVTADKMRALQVDGIFSNYPDRVA